MAACTIVGCTLQAELDHVTDRHQCAHYALHHDQNMWETYIFAFESVILSESLLMWGLIN